MSRKLLTLSVAAYNVSETIEQTLASLLLSEEELKELEVIIVNDGSTDDTAEKVRPYCEKYPDSFLLLNKENSGHGSTLNTSIERARGLYLKMLDGDDWAEQEGLRELLRYIRESREMLPDLLLTPFRLIYMERGRILRTEEVPCDPALGKIKVHALAVRTALFRENRVSISEHCFYVDTEYVYFALLYGKSYTLLPKTLYCYRLGAEGQSISYPSRIRRYQDGDRVTRRLLRLEKERENREQKNSLVFRELRHSLLLDSIEFQLVNLLLQKEGKLRTQGVRDIRQSVEEVPGLRQEFRKRSRKAWRILELTHFRGLLLLHVLFSAIVRVRRSGT